MVIIVPKQKLYILGGILWQGSRCVKGCIQIGHVLTSKCNRSLLPNRKNPPLTDFRFRL